MQRSLDFLLEAGGKEAVEVVAADEGEGEEEGAEVEVVTTEAADDNTEEWTGKELE